MMHRNLILPGSGLLIAALMLFTGAQLSVGSETKTTDDAPRAGQDEAPVKPEVMVVTMHADWCGTCKRLEPKLSAVRDALHDQPVLFMKLDLTDDRTRGQAEYLAALLEIDAAYQTYGDKTGFALVVNTETREVVDRLMVDDDQDAMARKIDAARAG